MISINGHVIGSDCYPNNERILKAPDLGRHVSHFLIDFKYETDIDISVLLMCKRHLDEVYDYPEVTLYMKYVPYSRMDREIRGYMFSLRHFCTTINKLHFDKVIILDPHSESTSHLLRRCIEMPIKPHIDRILARVPISHIFYPDAGALVRYSSLLPESIPTFYGEKKRDPQTGKILHYSIPKCPDIDGKSILIIDDLCAKGTTFHLASQILKERGASNIYLYVSHCEDSVYTGKLLKSGLISKIFTTDSILSDWSNPLLVNIERG